MFGAILADIITSSYKVIEKENVDDSRYKYEITDIFNKNSQHSVISILVIAGLDIIQNKIYEEVDKIVNLLKKYLKKYKLEHLVKEQDDECEIYPEDDPNNIIYYLDFLFMPIGWYAKSVREVVLMSRNIIKAIDKMTLGKVKDDDFYKYYDYFDMADEAMCLYFIKDGKNVDYIGNFKDYSNIDFLPEDLKPPYRMETYITRPAPESYDLFWYDEKNIDIIFSALLGDKKEVDKKQFCKVLAFHEAYYKNINSKFIKKIMNYFKDDSNIINVLTKFRDDQTLINVMSERIGNNTIILSIERGEKYKGVNIYKTLNIYFVYSKSVNALVRYLLIHEIKEYKEEDLDIDDIKKFRAYIKKNSTDEFKLKLFNYKEAIDYLNDKYDIKDIISDIFNREYNIDRNCGDYD